MLFCCCLHSVSFAFVLLHVLKKWLGSVSCKGFESALNLSHFVISINHEKYTVNVYCACDKIEQG